MLVCCVGCLYHQNSKIDRDEIRERITTSQHAKVYMLLYVALVGFVLCKILFVGDYCN
jgi:hypothetical protein